MFAPNHRRRGRGKGGGAVAKHGLARVTGPAVCTACFVNLLAQVPAPRHDQLDVHQPHRPPQESELGPRELHRPRQLRGRDVTASQAAASQTGERPTRPRERHVPPRLVVVPFPRRCVVGPTCAPCTANAIALVFMSLSIFFFLLLLLLLLFHRPGCFSLLLLVLPGRGEACA